MRRAYKLRAYPTRPQEGRAGRLLADHCELYNAALAERREAWRMRNRSVAYGDQSAQLKQIRAADPDGQGRHSFTAQQQTLRRLNAVFAGYFRRVRDAKGTQRRVGYPRFKPYQRFAQVLFVAGDGARWEPADGGRWAWASFQAVGRVKVGQHRPMVGRVKTLQLKREGRRWSVIVVTETGAVPLASTGRSVGDDLGVARFLTTSDGEMVANPRFLAAAQQRIVDLQRRKQRARPGSGNRRRLRRALAKEWRRLRNRRRDFHHKATRGLVDSKAESAGRRVVFVHPAHTWIDRHVCGASCDRPRQEIVVCPTHGDLDADLNGARNIAARAGLGSGQASAA